jgi:hypothetical protein
MRPAGYVTALVSLAALASVTFLGKSYETSLRGIDSNIHAAVAMSVTSGKNADGTRSFKPVLPIPIRNFSASAPARPGSQLDPDRYFNDHPFFLFWVNGLIMRALGPDAWSARILTALFSVGSVLLTFLIGHSLVSRSFGVVAALLLIFCRDFVLTSATMSLDTALVFFILLTFWFWIRRQWVALGIAAGVGLWIKTPLVLLIYPTAMICHALKKAPQRGFAQWGNLLKAGVVTIVVGSTFWIYVGTTGGWELVTDYWSRQLWGTAIQGRGQSQGTDWGFFFYYVRTGFLPGLPFLIVGLVQVIRRRRFTETAFLAPAVATLILATIVTALRFRLGHYVTPAFPFLALISAYSVRGWSARHEETLYAGVTIVALLLTSFLLTTPVALGPEAFVALKRFIPFIQTHGRCDDVIALVPGGEPVGADLDYRLVLNFYTGRPVQTVDCQGLGSLHPTPAWVILSLENFDRCLPAEARKTYPTQLRMGSQMLLSTQEKSTALLDLTPLVLELKAVTDCQAPPYPQDLWHRY